MRQPTPRILLVDDSLPIQRVVTQALAQLHLTLETVRDAPEALAHLKGPMPSLILLDFNIPPEGSKTLVETLRNRGVKSPIVILMTPLDDFNVARARRIGANGVFLKPFDPLDLQELVAKYCPEAWGEDGPPEGEQERSVPDPSAVAMERIRREVLEAAPGLRGPVGLDPQDIREALLEHLEGVMAPKGLHPLIEDLFREVVREEVVRILPTLVRQEVRARIREIERDARNRAPEGSPTKEGQGPDAP